MASHTLRATALIFIACALLAAFALLVGYQTETTITTDYVWIDQRTYPLIIRDERRAFLIPLAGKRCFANLPINPEWIAVRQQYETSYASSFQIEDTQSSHAVARLRCP